MRRPQAPDSRREDGAVAVITAITLTVLMLMAAFAIDLGMVRADTAREQSVSDMAAAAGAATLDVLETEWNAEDACDAALAYARANLDPAGSMTLTVEQSCSASFASVTSCSDATLLPDAVYELGRYTITITMPVPDGHPLMQDLDQGLDWDGLACERVGVRIDADSKTFFAGAGGASLGDSRRGAVGRAYAHGDDTAYASLIVLHPTACQSISTSNNNAEIRVGSAVVDGELEPGVITVYAVPASGACTNTGNQVISLGGHGNDSFITADGFVISYGLQQGAAHDQIYSDGKVASGNLSPRPMRGPAVNRSVIDHEYNCLETYPTGNTAPRWSPGRTGGSIVPLPYSGCDEGTPAYIQQLHATYNGYTAASVPEGWLVFPDDWEDASCKDAELTAGDIPAWEGDPDDEPSFYGTRMYIDCALNGGDVFQPSDFTVTGFDVVVSKGPFDLSTNDDLEIVGTGFNGTTLYIQDGSIERTGGDLRFDRVFVYLETGRVDLSGSAGTVYWEAPNISLGDNCGTIGGAPNAACFSKLALWMNRAGSGPQDRNRVGGGATSVMRGIFFSPNNEFAVRGSGDNTPLNCDPNAALPPGVKLNLREAQFWSRTIDVGGGGVITLCPSPDFAKEIQFPGSGLIR